VITYPPTEGALAGERKTKKPKRRGVMHGSRIGFIATAVLFGTMAACSDNTTDPASINSFNALMNGALVRPTAVSTPGTGSATFTHSGGNITFTVNYSGLRGTPSQAHIHSGTPTQGTNSPPGAGGIVLNLCGGTASFPVPCPTVKSGSFTGTAATAHLNGVTMDSLLYLMRQRNAYINLHTDTVGGGEIRGNLLGAP
jgi:hypothetical protein